MADNENQDVLRVLLDEPITPDTEAKVTSKFTKARSTVGDFARLVSGNGYDFRAFPSPVQAVAHARTPLIPMLISVVPPDNFPTGETSTKKVHAPMEQDVALTTMTERFRPQAGGARNITRIIPTSPERAERIDALRQQLEDDENLSAEDKAEIRREVTDLQRAARYIEVEVPESTPAGQEQQIERTDEYLRGMRNRYEDFQRSSRESRSRIATLNTPITGPNRRERKDPFADNHEIKDARKRQVADDLDYLREQALRMREMPPLFMYVNPTTFSRTYEHIVSDANKVRHGFSIENWGEQMPKIQATGQVGAFYVNDKDKLGRGSGGLAVGSRKGSYAYQQFLSLYQVYRSNGYIYNTQQRISLVGAISIFYDGTIYTGSFDSFSITQSEDKPFTFDYNFAFTVRFEQSMKSI